MSEHRDPAIKLFGRNIPVPDCHGPDSHTQIPAPSQVATDVCKEAKDAELKDTPMQKPCKDISSNSDEGRDNNYPNSNQETEVDGSHNSAEDQGIPNGLSDKEKVLKKPDKILPCPRCHSLDTKFCYFNNYNVNQPRHFCKNCHRYWTAGGTMRNVPVGAGRRKNKHSSLQYRQVMVTPDGLSVTQSDNPSPVSHQHLSRVGLQATSGHVQGVGDVLKFGGDAPLCESMAASLNLRDPTVSAKMGTAAVGNDEVEPSSSGCSVESTTVHENELPETQIEQVGFPGNYDSFKSEHPMQCYPGPQWAYPWNPGWNAMMFGPNNSIPNLGNTGSPPMMAISNFCPPSIAIPFVPASHWGCMPSWDGRNWNIPLVATTGCLSPSSSTSNSCSGNNSPTLGKHSRDASLQAEDKSEQSLWVPKTLRIDDPDEAAKSSIWDTLGIKPGNIQPIKKGGIFKAFQSKPVAVSHTSDTDADAGQVLKANPAALSRSQTFQENT